MMRSVRLLRKWIWRQLKALTIGKIMLVLFFLIGCFGIFAVIKESQIPDELRLLPVPKQHTNPMAVPQNRKAGSE